MTKQRRRKPANGTETPTKRISEALKLGLKVEIV
jgi:hypothetical protein